MRKNAPKETSLVLLNLGQVPNKLKFVDSPQIVTSTSSDTHQSCLRIKNDNLHRMVEIIFSYFSPVLITNRSATFL